MLNNIAMLKETATVFNSTTSFTDNGKLRKRVGIKETFHFSSLFFSYISKWAHIQNIMKQQNESSKQEFIALFHHFLKNYTHCWHPPFIYRNGGLGIIQIRYNVSNKSDWLLLPDWARSLQSIFKMSVWKRK